MAGGMLGEQKRLLICVLAAVLAPCETRFWKGKGKGGGQWVRLPKPSSAPSPPTEHSFDSSDCPKCMTVVMRLVQPSPRGCPAANGTIVTSTSIGRVPTAYCDTLLPKRRSCVAYSFGLEGEHR